MTLQGDIVEHLLELQVMHDDNPALFDGLAKAIEEIEALRIERDARPTQENAFKAIEAARAEERAKCEAEIASLRADCRMKDELLTAAVDDYDKAAKAIEALRAALKPFANAVYNDNGDMTVSAGEAKYDDFVRAYFAYRLARTKQGVEK